MDESQITRSRVAIIGAGRLGLALGRCLLDAGVAVVATSSRSPAGRARAQLELEVPSHDDPGVVAGAAEVIFICVPDDAIGEIAEGCAGAGSAARRWFIHTSGSVGLEPLEPLAARGHGVLAMHPLHVFTGHERADLRGVAAAITAADGDGRALGRMFARVLGMAPFDLVGAERATYHAAAALAANATMSLLDAAATLGERSGMDPLLARRAFTHLARAAVDRVEVEGVHAALTGPVSRADFGTIDAHRCALRRVAPELLDLYDEHVRALARVAREDGRIDREQEEALCAMCT